MINRKLTKQDYRSPSCNAQLFSHLILLSFHSCYCLNMSQNFLQWKLNPEVHILVLFGSGRSSSLAYVFRVWSAGRDWCFVGKDLSWHCLAFLHSSISSNMLQRRCWHHVIVSASLQDHELNKPLFWYVTVSESKPICVFDLGCSGTLTLQAYMQR